MSWQKNKAVLKALGINDPPTYLDFTPDEEGSPIEQLFKHHGYIPEKSNPVSLDLIQRTLAALVSQLPESDSEISVPDITPYYIEPAVPFQLPESMQTSDLKPTFKREDLTVFLINHFLPQATQTSGMDILDVRGRRLLVYGNGREEEILSVTRIKKSVFSLASLSFFQKGILPLNADAILEPNKKCVLFFKSDNNMSLLDIFGIDALNGKLFSSGNTLWNPQGLFRFWNDLTFNNSNQKNFPLSKDDLVSKVFSEKLSFDQITTSLLSNRNRTFLTAFNHTYANHPSTLVFLTSNSNIGKKKLTSQETVEQFANSISQDDFPLIPKEQLVERFTQLSKESNIEAYLVHVNQAQTFLTP